MSNFVGYRTHQTLRRHARAHSRRERRSMEWIGVMFGAAGWAVFAALCGVVMADSLTGLDTIVRFVNWLRGAV